ncbi:sensor domain-containing diguanylate cyclase [Leptospira yasudae]|uniref:sensor domain-containing diguanylate cyclase n=1 Tax=Leptospira yasudae TaxID=2202201 RepID=UPI0010843591|nr:sensor domain-containing diguanylate cyclase [Leptospira yasudae]TGK27041.1 sensor domain-containing diguanylate cyclase [Leptospira yasudae]TGM08165.1 sensor domain-containing diguanylate cyclase [Leptospira yasudae]
MIDKIENKMSGVGGIRSMDRNRKRLAFIFVGVLMLATLAYEIHRTLFNTQQVIALRTYLLHDYFARLDIQLQTLEMTVTDYLNKNSQETIRAPLNFRIVKKLEGGAVLISESSFASKRMRFVGGLTADKQFALSDSLQNRELIGAFALDGQMQILTAENSEIVRSYYTSRQGFLYIVPKKDVKEVYFRKDMYNESFWEKIAINSKNRSSPIIFQFYQDPFDKVSMLRLSKPVLRNGKVIGAITIDLSLEKIRKILNAGVSKGDSYLMGEGEQSISKELSLDVQDLTLKIAPDSFQRLNFTGKYLWTAYEVIEGRMALVHRISIFSFVYLSFKNLLPYWALIVALFILMILYSKLGESLKIVSHISNSDYLTGISNRRHFLSSVQSYLAMNRKREPWAFVMADIDYFKSINDRFGHEAGDIVLVQIAKLMDSVILKPNFVSRWGGEEFAIFLCNVDPETAIQLAEFLCKEVEKNIRLKDGSPVTLSIGVANGKLGESFEEACRRADEALYCAKANGRNCVFS